MFSPQRSWCYGRIQAWHGPRWFWGSRKVWKHAYFPASQTLSLPLLYDWTPSGSTRLMCQAHGTPEWGKKQWYRAQVCDTNSLLKSHLSNLIQQPPVPVGEVNIIPKGRKQRNIFVAGETIGKGSWKEVLFVLTDRLKLDKSVIWKLMQSVKKVWAWQQLDKLTININLYKTKVFILFFFYFICPSYIFI